MIVEEQIRVEQIKFGYPTSEDIKVKEKKVIPLGEIDYNALGGYETYHQIKTLYWKKRLSEITWTELALLYNTNVYEIKKAYESFDEEVNKPVKLYD